MKSGKGKGRKMAERKTYNLKCWEINWCELKSKVKNKNERQRTGFKKKGWKKREAWDMQGRSGTWDQGSVM